ncbi:hypothetical protein GQ42DRAFT_154898 [Ramicandelaber brevisporus]|nr:hypothetical protein GQ42DRAFT_154898 [Ramicandelaber brevisporus]
MCSESDNRSAGWLVPMTSFVPKLIKLTIADMTSTLEHWLLMVCGAPNLRVVTIENCRIPPKLLSNIGVVAKTSSAPSPVRHLKLIYKARKCPNEMDQFVEIISLFKQIKKVEALNCFPEVEAEIRKQLPHIEFSTPADI